MKSGYSLTPAADQDIVEIWLYTSETWGAARANNYLEQIEQCLRGLVENPGLGKRRDEIRPGYRSLHCDHHLIFYREKPKQQIDVVRFLHERMDHQTHFE
ncbi:type II toxin-antitoxin system RelE/ParE family toxin [bacterium]|nr:type II toxin-antitoxin system RelE/ParE family toxin [bacterium]